MRLTAGVMRAVVQLQDALGDELAVEAVTDEVDAQRRGDEPDRADGFATVERNRRQRERAQYRHQQPADVG